MERRYSLIICAILCVLFSISPAWGSEITARERVTKGTLEFGVLTSFFQGHNVFDNQPSANRSAIFVLPQLGQIITDEIGSGPIMGNVEFMVEPVAAHYYQPFSASAFGGSLVLKYNFLSFGRWMPFWDGGAGIVWTDLAPRIPEQSIQWNFILETGIGLSYFVWEPLAITVGIRFHHISNAGLGERNVGINGWLFNAGFSFFTP